MSAPPAASGLLPYLVLAVALVGVSHGAIFARLADAAPLAIAAWRVGMAALLVLPAAWVAGRRGPWPRRALAQAAGAGLLLALHFAAWIASLQYTSIARSVLLVCTAPVWVALIELVLGRVRPAPATWAALACTSAGAFAVVSSGFGGPASPVGDALALAGAVAMAGYLLLAREAQAALPFLPYLGAAYGCAALALWAAALAAGTALAGFDAATWWALAGMAVVSQLIGHGGANWSLRALRPLFVGVVLVGEPVLAALLGWWLLGEAPEPGIVPGAALVLGGIALAARAAR